MDENFDIKDFLLTRLNDYDLNREKYKELIENQNIIIEGSNNENNTKDTIIKFRDDNNEEIYKAKITILGTLDVSTKIWLWSWVTPRIRTNETIDARDILNYGLDFEPFSISNIHYFIKSHFVNSRIYMETNFALDVHLALCFYILKRGKFIYPRYKKENGVDAIVYYLVY
jgi:hypothetical protein